MFFVSKTNIQFASSSSRDGKMKLKVEGEADGQPKAASTHYRSIVRFLFVQASSRIVECSTDFKPGC